MLRKVILGFIGFIGFCLIAGFLSYKWFDNYLVEQWQLPRATEVQQVSVGSGTNIYRVANQVFANADQDAWWLRVWFKLHPHHSQIKKGMLYVFQTEIFHYLLNNLNNADYIFLCQKGQFVRRMHLIWDLQKK